MTRKKYLTPEAFDKLKLAKWLLEVFLVFKLNKLDFPILICLMRLKLREFFRLENSEIFLKLWVLHSFSVQDNLPSGLSHLIKKYLVYFPHDYLKLDNEGSENFYSWFIFFWDIRSWLQLNSSDPINNWWKLILFVLFWQPFRLSPEKAQKQIETEVVLRPFTTEFSSISDFGRNVLDSTKQSHYHTHFLKVKFFIHWRANLLKDFCVPNQCGIANV